MSELNDLLPIAARLVRADCLRKLEDLADRQGSVRGPTILKLVYEANDALRREAIAIREVYDSNKKSTKPSVFNQKN